MTRALYLASVWLFAFVQAVASWFPVSAPKATQTDFSFLSAGSAGWSKRTRRSFSPDRRIG